MRRIFSKSLFCATTLCFVSLVSSLTEAKPGKSVSVKSIPIEHFQPSNPDRNIFGRLKFLGGLELQSENENFGGISGIRLLDNESFLAITDKGRWLTGHIEREDAKPSAITSTRIGRLRKANGKRLKGKKNSDAEGLEILGEEFLISFERNHRIGHFSWHNDKLQQVSGLQVIDLNGYELENNHGPEAIAYSENSNILYVFPEGDEISDAHYRGFTIKDNEISEIRVTRKGSYRMTDAAFSENGDLFLLERYHSVIFGLSIRIRKFSPSELASGESLTGSILFEAGWEYEIDNMEGLSLTTLEDGSTRLTLISDDNFSSRQRTLLLEFQLTDN